VFGQLPVSAAQAAIEGPHLILPPGDALAIAGRVVNGGLNEDVLYIIARRDGVYVRGYTTGGPDSEVCGFSGPLLRAEGEAGGEALVVRDEDGCEVSVRITADRFLWGVRDECALVCGSWFRSEVVSDVARGTPTQATLAEIAHGRKILDEVSRVLLRGLGR